MFVFFFERQVLLHALFDSIKINHLLETSLSNGKLAKTVEISVCYYLYFISTKGIRQIIYR